MHGNQKNETLQKLSKLFSSSTKIKIDDLTEVLNLERAKLFNKLIDWSEQFDYQIDGDVLKVNQVNVNEFVDVLDKEFEAWTQNNNDKV